MTVEVGDTVFFPRLTFQLKKDQRSGQVVDVRGEVLRVLLKDGRSLDLHKFWVDSVEKEKSMPEERGRETDLVLPLGVHAFVLDTTKGNVNVYVGPMKQPLSPQQDVPVVMKDNGRFEPLQLDKAIQNNVGAYKGQYVILRNPARENKQPKMGGMSTPDPEHLRMGEMVNLPGPITFPLWPMQRAEVVDGHHLKSNQYLLVRVYDEEAARKNWGSGTIKLVEGKSEKEEESTTTKVSEIDPTTLVIGQQLIIKGTEVSFYIPPTGVEVIKENGSYVREALTLERLEYCLLVDEDGNKRYVRGPEVVFPQPTESFKLNDDSERKSRAYELNEISGLHVKVIADYGDEFGENHKEGDELFITGRRTKAEGSEEETQIYFPRVEHALLKYGGRTRYHAVAIPAGEARYVLNRLNGEVRLEHGPSMFLPDPRHEVIVKRVLSDNEVGTYYPGNAKVAMYNQGLRNELEQQDEADLSGIMTNMPSYRTGHMAANIMSSMTYASSEAPTRSAPLGSRAIDAIDRGTKYTPPRTIILDSKFEGAVQIRPWTGYAIQVVNQKGDRRIEVGPKTVLLEFDERLEVLSLSTGTPKSMDNPLKTVYLRISNNAVSDEFVVKTKDLVPVKLKLKYLVRFEDDKKDRWFNDANYIQQMVDRFRSLVSNHVRTLEIRPFYAEASALLRNLILGIRAEGKDRPGHAFEENGMRVVELDVLDVTIADVKIAESMKQLQVDRITNALEIDRAQSQLTLVKEKERSAQETLSLKHETFELQSNISRDETETKLELSRAQVQGDGEVSSLRESVANAVATLVLERAKLEADTSRQASAVDSEIADQELARRVNLIVEEARADKSRLEAIGPKLIEAISALAQTGLLKYAADNLTDLAIVRQQSLGGVFEQMFKGTPVEGLLENVKKLGSGTAVGS